MPSSTRFCRAIKFLFAKETPELILRETQRITKQIDDMSDFVFEDKVIKFNLVLTMIDGKVCHALTNTKSTKSCYICQAKPRELNDLKNIDKRIPKVENYNFGLSSLK